ncbi:MULTISPECIES: glycosyltransferase family 2 protein [Salipiger]|uniref:glycosyltransferase family 2 protein n=1 Tax=Salipiger TaxID=263377 RepID=UPI003515C08B
MPESRPVFRSTRPARGASAAESAAPKIPAPKPSRPFAVAPVRSLQFAEAPAPLWRGPVLHLERNQRPPDPALAPLLPPETCLRYAALPWRRVGNTLLLATARPERFDAARAALPPGCDDVVMATASIADIHAEIAARHGPALARDAETRLRPELSCRDLNRLTPRRALAAGGFALAALTTLALAPSAFFLAAASLAIAVLILAQITRLAALLASRRSVPHAPAGPVRLPRISLLVPLFREERIAAALLDRLSRLDYPRNRLEVLLLLEASDDTTRAALAATRLPPWLRVIEVPGGPIATKPRALNYGLTFAQGDIVGIYDAEDSPAPDQLLKVAGHFCRAPPETACLQGILDFYNPHANWLSRCFTIEYATWFRLVLPGLARLGFPIPLGGTTVFFRREALDRVGGWDAHNVTEDADLGIRLARFGYVTDLVPLVTREEANNRTWPWIRQRSRWLKGYMVTWLVHSRRPLTLLRDLGAWRFVGMQVLFLTTILQFLLAPALWSFWLLLLGWQPAALAILTEAQKQLLFGGFLVAEAISLMVSVAAVARSPHQGLLPWVPTLFLYFPLATVAIYKALLELVTRPFFWDKTMHGHSAPDHEGADLPERPAQGTAQSIL